MILLLQLFNNTIVARSQSSKQTQGYLKTKQLDKTAITEYVIFPK
jgi:hypothetical protein